MRYAERRESDLRETFLSSSEEKKCEKRKKRENPGLSYLVGAVVPV